MIKQFVSQLRAEGSFIQNFAFVFGGKSVIFIIGFLFTPFIARVYNPEAYGTYAIYNTLAVILAFLVSLRVPVSFIVIKGQQRFKSVVKVLITFIFFGSIVIMLFSFMANDFLLGLTKNQNLKEYWFLIGLGTFLKAMTDLFGNWNVREKAFKKSTFVALTENISTKVSSLGIGIIFQGLSIGLILGEFVGKSLHIFGQILFFVKKRYSYLLPSLSLRKMKWLITEYREYPSYILPATLIGQFSSTIIIIFLSIEFDAKSVGYYSMSTGLITIPVMLIAYASQPLLSQKIAELKQNRLSVDSPIHRFSFGILLLSFPILFGGILLGEVIVNLFLGEGWSISAKIVSWMVPLIGLQLIAIPMNGVLVALKKNKEVLYCDSIRLIILGLTLVVVYFVKSSYLMTVKFIIIGLFLSYFLTLLLSYRYSGVKSLTHMFLLIGYISSAVLCLWIIDFF